MDQIFGNISLLFEFPVVNVKIILDGLMIGAIFALAAYGLALVWGVMNVKNLAQGDFVILGGYVAWYATQKGMPALLGVPLAFFVLWLIGGGLNGTKAHNYFTSLANISLLNRMGVEEGRKRQAIVVAASLAIAVAIVQLIGYWNYGGLGFTAPMIVMCLLIALLVPFARGGLWLLFVVVWLASSLLFGVGQLLTIGEFSGTLFRDAGVLAVIVTIILLGGIYSLVISRVIERDLFTSLLATFGIAIMLAQLMNLLFGSDTQSVKLPYETLYFFDGMVDVPIAKLIGVVMAGGLAIAVVSFMKYSRMGQAIRATSQDPRAARVLGIDTEKVYAFTFSLNAAICGAAGAIIVMVWLIQPFYGIAYSIRSFVIVTAAGLGNLPGVIAAGLGIGVLEQYGAHIFGIGYQQAIAVLLLLVVLIVRLIQQQRMRQVLA